MSLRLFLQGKRRGFMQVFLEEKEIIIILDYVEEIILNFKDIALDESFYNSVDKKIEFKLKDFLDLKNKLKDI
jgi:hypothetical protein